MGTEKNETVVVEMRQQTIHRYNDQLYRLWPGMKVEVNPELAEQWRRVGLADVVTGKDARGAVPISDHREFQAASERMMAEAPVRQEVTRTDLRIAALHGSVAAARQLDQMGAEAPVQPPEGTPEPLQLTNERAPARAEAPKQTTGESARGALGR